MRFIVHIDMNSFFASVEQQVNPWLRGKAIGVGGRPGARSIIAAASREAKGRGIATAMGVAEARAVCPDLILVTGDNRRYHAVSRQIMTALLSITPDIEVFSVDECFADLTSLAGSWQEAVDLAVEMKRQIRQRVGEYLSCSIGLSTNRFLAKLGSDTLKPNGLHVITPTGQESLTVPLTGPGRANLQLESVDDLLERVELIEFCGLGPRLNQHLARLGIRTTFELRQADPNLLKRIFGYVVGQRLWEWSWGLDGRSLTRHFEPRPPQSITRSITLPPALDRPQDGRAYLFDLAEQVGRELRRQKLAARRLTVWIGYTDRHGWGGHRLLARPIDAGEEIYRQALSIWQGVGFRPIRLVGVGVNLLCSAVDQTVSWLPEDQQRLAVCQAQDAVSERFGARSVHRATWLTIAGRQTEAAHAFGFRYQEGD